VSRTRSAADERQVVIGLTHTGRAMEQEAAAIYDGVLCATGCTPSELAALKRQLDGLRGTLADHA